MKIAVIPARSGSTRIPLKNVRPFYGKPIIAYSIEAALKSKMFDCVWVSSEDGTIGRIAERYGARWWWREPRLADNNVGTQEVAREVVYWLLRQREMVKYCCVVYATAPLMLADDLIKGFASLGKTAFVHTVGPDGQDAGQWYWGSAKAFIDRVPLEENSLHYMLPAARTCDINTIEDWERAERMFWALREAA